MCVRNKGTEKIFIYLLTLTNRHTHTHNKGNHLQAEGTKVVKDTGKGVILLQYFSVWF